LPPGTQFVIVDSSQRAYKCSQPYLPFWLNSPIKPTLITDRQPHSSLTRVTFDRSERYGVGTVVLAEPWVVTKQLDPVCLLGSADVIGMGHYPLPARFFMLALSCMSDVEP